MKRFLFLLIPLLLTACGSNNPKITKTKIQQNYKDYSKKSFFENCSCTPSSGNIKLLIIPIWFDDSDAYITSVEKKNNVREDIRKAYLGTNEEVGYRSVKTYYEEESSKKVHIDGKVTNWYSVGACDDYKTSYPKTLELLRNAVNWAKDTEGLDLTDYDNDKDGHIDGVIMVYAHPDYRSFGKEDESNFWAYCGWDQSQPDPSNPVASVFFWASYDFMYEKDNDYTFERTGSRYGYGHTYRQIIDTETFIHEMGHMFGLSDYYDYERKFIPAGRYTMQDENVSTHDPFSYIALNWADPYIPTKSCTITIGDFATSHDVILLTPEWNPYDSAFDEYILLELYSLTGLNEMYKGDRFHNVTLPDAVGIRVWHVDARLASFESVDEENLEFHITNNVNDGNVYRIAHNAHTCIKDTFPEEEYGSLLCENQNMLQLISHTPDRNYGEMPDEDKSNHFIESDLFKKGDSFDLNTYKKQFININTGKFYSSSDTDIKLNNEKKLNWSFKVENITTVNGASTATINLTK